MSDGDADGRLPTSEGDDQLLHSGPDTRSAVSDVDAELSARLQTAAADAGLRPARLTARVSRTMNSRWTAIGLLGALVYAPAAGAEPVSRAEFAGPTPAYVSFWQMGRVELGGQGWCVAKFGFDGSNLGVPIEDLTIAVRVFDKDGKDKGAGQIQLRTLGGDHASWVKDASFDGLDIPEWRAIVSDVGSSPLCWDGISLVFESAAGTQGGRRVDLLKYGQLHYVVPKLLKVTLKHKRG